MAWWHRLREYIVALLRLLLETSLCTRLIQGEALDEGDVADVNLFVQATCKCCNKQASVNSCEDVHGTTAPAKEEAKEENP